MIQMIKRSQTLPEEAALTPLPAMQVRKHWRDQFREKWVPRITEKHWLDDYARKHVPLYRGWLLWRMTAIVISPLTLSAHSFLTSTWTLVERVPLDLIYVPMGLHRHLKQGRTDWDGWTPPQRKSVLKQAAGWFVVFGMAMLLAIFLPLTLKILPLSIWFAGWIARDQWDLIRYLLNLPQIPEIKAVEVPVTDAEIVDPELPLAPKELGEAALVPEIAVQREMVN